MQSQIDLKPETSWFNAFHVYLNRRVIAMLFLGFSAGVPLLLVFGTLSIWLTRAGIERDTVTFLSMAALAYSFKFVWTPLVDKLPIPFFHQVLGRRRSWLLLTQIMVISSIIWISFIDPAINLQLMTYAVVLLAFSSASQDIVIDAYRIESQAAKYQTAMSAVYTSGYRIGMVVSGFLALKMVSWFGGGETYSYQVWSWIYLAMSGFMLIGVITTLLIPEPDINRAREAYLHNTSEYFRFIMLVILVAISFILSLYYLDPALSISSFLSEQFGWNGPLSKFLGQVVRIAIAISVSAIVALISIAFHLVNRKMVYESYVDPILDFFRRFGKAAVFILLLIGFYRISDIVLGVIANVFYLNIGFSEDQIADFAKLYGLIMTIIGGLLGGVLSVRYGVMRILLAGSILVVCTNMLFMLLARAGNNIDLLALVIAADNLSAGIATAAFIAYLSSLTNISFTAMQYAIFSSLMTLLPKVIGGYSGSIVNQTGYEVFFLIASLMGIPVIFLILFLMYKMPLHSEHQNDTSKS